MFATLHPTFYFRPPPPGPPLLEKEGNKQLVQLLTAGPGSIINRGAPGMAQKDYKYKCKQKYKMYGSSLLKCSLTSLCLLRKVKVEIPDQFYSFGKS